MNATAPDRPPGDPYYSALRQEILDAVPLAARRLLDIGCGAGTLGRALKARQPCNVIGIEIVAAVAKLASEHLDAVLVGDAMARLPELPDAAFDTIVMADIVEHVADTDALLALALRKLAGNGHLVVSVPNVRHWSLLRELLAGDWQYRDWGILDRTHLRFFTRTSMTRHLHAAGLVVERTLATTYGGSNPIAALRAILAPDGIDRNGLLADLDRFQYVFVCRRPGASA